MPTTPDTEATEPSDVTRDDFGQKKKRYGKVTMEDGRKAIFQSLTASELASWDAGCLDEHGKVNDELLKLQQPKLLALCLTDKTGKRLFSDDEFQLLADTDSLIITPIFHAIRKHVGLDRRVDAEKN